MRRLLAKGRVPKLLAVGAGALRVGARRVGEAPLFQLALHREIQQGLQKRGGQRWPSRTMGVRMASHLTVAPKALHDVGRAAEACERAFELLLVTAQLAAARHVLLAAGRHSVAATGLVRGTRARLAAPAGALGGHG